MHDPSGPYQHPACTRGDWSCDTVTNFSHQIGGELGRLAPQHGAKGFHTLQSCTLARCPYTPYIGPGLLYEPRVAH